MTRKLSLSQAQHIIVAALEKALALNLEPLCVAVLDGGGHLIALARQDGASLLRPQIAIAKATGALLLGVSSRKIAEIAAERPSFIASLSGLAAAGIIPAAGGVIIPDTDGTPLGAIGITGDTSDNDEACALFGIAAEGF